MEKQRHMCAERRDRVKTQRCRDKEVNEDIG